MQYVGELASLTVAFLWSIGPSFFTLAGNRVGAWIINRLRMLYGLLIVMGIHWVIYGMPLPLDASGDRWLWLGLSGFVGLALGDIALFNAFTTIGTRLSMLIYSLAPVMSAIAGLLFFDESLSTLQFLAIIITISAITYVGLLGMGKEDNIEKKSKKYRLGILSAFLGAIGQAFGLILSKMGIYGDFPALSGLVIRLLGGALFIWFITLIQKQVKSTFIIIKNDPKAHLFTWMGTLTGPVGGIYFSLVGLKYTSLGIASILQSLSPIFLLPIAAIVFKEKITWKAVLGTLIAMLGVALLFIG